MEPPRQRMFRYFFKQAQEEIKQKHGSGEYSFAEGMNRNSFRKICRNIAKKYLRNHIDTQTQNSSDLTTEKDVVSS